MTQLSALFTLCGLILYVIGRKKYEKKESYGISLIVISIVCFWPLATLSKQNGILLPLLILIIEFFFFYKDSVLDRVKKLRLVLAIPVFIPLLIIFVVILVNSAWLLDGYSGRNFTLYERLISQPRILIDYIGNLLLFPGVSPMGLFHDDYIKSTNLFTPVTTIPSIVFLILILTAAFLTIGKQTGIISFGFVFFYVAHIVESTFIPLELYFEHRNYLPSIGIYFSIVTGIALLLQNIKYRPFVIALLLIAPLTFSILTYQRSLIWQKKTSIYFLSEIHHPDSPRVNEGLAFIHLLNNDANSALKHLDKVVALEQRQRAPEFYFKYLLAYCYGNKNMPDDMYKNKIKIKSLSNELSTVIYLNKFIESVVNGRCNSLNLNYIAEDFSIAITNRDKRYDRDEKSYVNLLLAELLDYLGRDREAEIQRLNAVIHSK
jgi:protein O-mannosyl-transferase